MNAPARLQGLPSRRLVCSPGSVLVMLMTVSLTGTQARQHTYAESPQTQRVGSADRSGASHGADRNRSDPKPQTGNPLRDERQRIQLLKELAKGWEQKDFAGVAACFNEELRSELPTEKLAALWSNIISKHGPPRDVDPERRQRVGTSMLYLIELKWRDSQLDLRISCDDANRVAGIWIDAPLGRDGKSLVPAGGIKFGSEIQRIAARNGTLEVRVENADGVPPESCRVAFYRELIDGEEPGTNDWTDPKGRIWRYFATNSGTDSARANRLQPGWYRTLAGRKSTNTGPLAVSEPVQITDSEPSASVTVRWQAGAELRVTTVSNESVPLDGCHVLMEPVNDEWPPLKINPLRAEDEFTFKDVPAGQYRIVATRRADRWDGMRYETAPPPPVDLREGDSKSIQVQLVGRRLTQKEIDGRAPWVATGKVTDTEGNPIEGVEIWASAGWGSLHSAKIATTDAEGRYHGRFSTSGWIAVRQDDEQLHLVSAQVGAHIDSMSEANINRHGGLAAANRLPREGEPTPKWLQARSVGDRKIFTPGIPVQIDFVMKPCASVSVTVLDHDGAPMAEKSLWLDGEQLPPASSVMASGKTDAKGRHLFGKVPVGFDWWFQAAYDERKYARSQSFHFEDHSYRLVFQQTTEAQTGKEVLSLVKATRVDDDDAGEDDDAEEDGSEEVSVARDVSSKILADSPSQRPPLDEIQQAKGREILERIREVNRYWLGSQPAEIDSYAYDFHLIDRDPIRITVPNRSIFARRGISYFSVIDAMTADPNNVVFRSIETGEDKITLVYSLKQSARVKAGNGVRGSWRGYFEMSVDSGTLVIDANTMTPLEHRAKGIHETYSNYASIGDKYYVPLRIQIDKMDLDWKFKLHPGGLWLFDRNTATESKPEPTAWVTNVQSKLMTPESLLQRLQKKRDELQQRLDAVEKELNQLDKQPQ